VSGCTSNASNILAITVNIPPIIIVIDTNGAFNNLPNGSVLVTATGNTATLEYSVDGGATWQTNDTITGLMAGNYILQVRDGNGCITSGSFTISNTILTKVILEADTSSSCPGDNVFISVFVSGMANVRSFDLCMTYDPGIAIFMGISTMNPLLANVITNSSVPGQLVITWDGASDVTIPDGDRLFKLQFKGKSSGTSLIGWNNFLPGVCGIFDNADEPMMITFLPGEADFFQSPDATITGKSDICTGEPVTLSASGDTLDHQWILPDGTTFTGQQYIITASALSDSGNYILLATNTIGCTNTDTLQLAVHEIPKIVLAETDILCAERQYELNAGEGYNAYLWQDGSTLPTYATTGEGDYWVHVTDTYGCQGGDTVQLVVCPVELYTPTAFSPNNDGKNDVFKAIYSAVDLLENYNMLIFNRWGELLFETSSIDEAWDGTFHGVPCPAGEYVFIIRFKKPAGKTMLQKSPYKGVVTLIR